MRRARGLSYRFRRSTFIQPRELSQSALSGFALPNVECACPAGVKRKHVFPHFSRLLHSPDGRVYRGQEVRLRRESESLNPVTYFCGLQWLFCGPEYNATRIGYALHQTKNCRTALFDLHQIVQRCNSFLLFCNLGFEPLPFLGHMEQLIDCFFEVSTVIFGHSGI